MAELSQFETEVLEALSDYAEVVGPGDTLVILGHDHWTPDQVLTLHQGLARAVKALNLGFEVIFLPGKSMEVRHAAQDQAATSG